MLDQLIAQSRLRGALAALGAPLPLGLVPFDRVEGMLLGLAVADSLGNTTKGQLPSSRREHPRYNPGYCCYERPPFRRIGAGFKLATTASSWITRRPSRAA